MANKIVRLSDGNGDTILPIGYAQGGTSIDLLWTNPSPTSDFASQTISLDLSDYQIIVVTAKQIASQDGYEVSNFLFKLNNLMQRIYTMSASGRGENREIKLNDNSIYFGLGYASDGGQANSRCIPVKIYGIKTAWIVPTEVNGMQYVEVE